MQLNHRPLGIKERDRPQPRVDQAFRSLVQLRIARRTTAHEQAAIRLRNPPIRGQPIRLRARADEPHHRLEFRQRLANRRRRAIRHLIGEGDVPTQRFAVLAV